MSNALADMAGRSVAAANGAREMSGAQIFFRARYSFRLPLALTQ